jgi:hypothetical protein
VIGHSFGARKVALPSAPRPIGLDGSIKLCHFLPIGTFGVGIEQARIGDEMFPVIVRSLAVGAQSATRESGG